MSLALGAAIFALVMTLVQLGSTLIARYRCPARQVPVPAPSDAPPISLVRPVCGLDNFAEETLASGFRLDYPHYEIIFCIADPDDPVAPLVSRLMAANPQVPSRLLFGDDRVSANPKLNNCVKGWHAATHPWIVLADSNVLMPRDYLQRCLAAWKPDTGLVCSTPIGSRPGNFWAEVECGFLNTLQARWQYVGEALGLGFAQGKTMLWRRDFLNAHGSIEALGAEIAEDAASTKLVRRHGLHVHLVDSPFEQPLGARTAAEVWARQVRWARLRRKTFPPFFALEILTGSFLPVLATAYAASAYDYNGVVAGLLVAALWMAAEVQLAVVAGWRVTWMSPFVWILRDLSLPVLHVVGWGAGSFVWRGNVMDVRETKASLGIE
jgi:ceramide glucosyltransferase